jgi:hypothetical protein
VGSAASGELTLQEMVVAMGGFPMAPAEEKLLKFMHALLLHIDAHTPSAGRLPTPSFIGVIRVFFAVTTRCRVDPLTLMRVTLLGSAY